MPYRPLDRALMVALAVVIVLAIVATATIYLAWIEQPSNLIAARAVIWCGVFMVATILVVCLAPEHKAEPPSSEDTQPVAVHPELTQLPPQGFQALAQMEAIDWPVIQHNKIHRALQVCLAIGTSVRKLKDNAKLSEAEATVICKWLAGHDGWTTPYQGGIALTKFGREGVERLLPFARGLRVR